MEINGVTEVTRPRHTGRSPLFFSLEHAQDTLPLVRRIVADIVKQHKRICALEEKCHKPRPDGSEEEFEALRNQCDAELDKLSSLADELSAIGCELKDWRRGIVDFRTRYQDRDVELCWRIGEERIQCWHELDDGFHARQAIDADFVANASHTEPVS